MHVLRCVCRFYFGRRLSELRRRICPQTDPAIEELERGQFPRQGSGEHQDQVQTRRPRGARAVLERSRDHPAGKAVGLRLCPHPSPPPRNSAREGIRNVPPLAQRGEARRGARLEDNQAEGCPDSTSRTFRTNRQYCFLRCAVIPTVAVTIPC